MARAVIPTAITVRRTDRNPIWNMLTAPERKAAWIRRTGTMIPTSTHESTVKSTSHGKLALEKRWGFIASRKFSSCQMIAIIKGVIINVSREELRIPCKGTSSLLIQVSTIIIFLECSRSRKSIVLDHRMHQFRDNNHFDTSKKSWIRCRRSSAGRSRTGLRSSNVGRVCS